METGLSLSTLLLGEITLVLLIALFCSIQYSLKQKKLLKLLLEKYREIKAEQKLAANSEANFYDGKKAESKNTILEYFERSLADSLQRYEKNTGSHHPHLDSNHSFSARVAALRCLYLIAEKEVFDERGITHAGWGLFERKLADIVRWQDKSSSRRQEVRDNRLRLMQDRLDALKESGKKNKYLQEKVERLLQSEKKLKQYKVESQQTISNLQNMLEQLKQLSAIEKLPAEPCSDVDFFERKTMADPAGVSAENNGNVIEMIRELKTYKSQFSAEIKEKMDSYMNILEVELMKSDQYIGSLKKELQQEKMKVTNYAIMLRDARSEEKGTAHAHEDIGAILSDMMAPIEQKNVFVEIKQLRENNRIQRELILKMGGEIQLLKASFNPMDSTDVRQEKEKEIERLERMVKECQGCIDTLESEVDLLYSQLQERAGVSAGEADTEGSSEELTMITRELEKTIAHYQQLHAINRLTLELMKCETLSSLAEHIIQFIKGFNAPIGFIIDSVLGKTEYFPEAIFNESTIALMEAPGITDSLIHLDEGTLFSFSKIHLMHLNTPTGSHPILETSLQSLVSAAEVCIKNIEARKSNKKRNQETEIWVKSTKNHLANIDIQYASQVEENKKTFNSFIAEIRRAYPLLGLQGQGAIVLDNAINEYEERMHLLLTSGDVIDHEIMNLIEHVDKIKLSSNE